MSQSHSELLLGTDGLLPEGVKGYRRDGRRIYERGFRERVAAECRDSGKSLSGIALSYGVNANLVRRWAVQYGAQKQTMLPVSLSTLPVPVPGGMTESQSSRTGLRIEIDGVSVYLDGYIESAIVQAVVHALMTR